MAAAVVVYTSNSCPYCLMVKQWLDQHRIRYEERNVGRDPAHARRLLDMGYTGVPVTVAAGQVVVGFQPAELQRLLQPIA